MKELMFVKKYGNKNLVEVKVYGENLDVDPEFSWVLVINGKEIDWKFVPENAADFVYDTDEDAFGAALDYLVEHYLKTEENEKNEDVKFDRNFDRETYLDEMENPENNIEEVPEDFRMN